MLVLVVGGKTDFGPPHNIQLINSVVRAWNKPRGAPITHLSRIATVSTVLFHREI